GRRLVSAYAARLYATGLPCPGKHSVYLKLPLSFRSRLFRCPRRRQMVIAYLVAVGGMAVLFNLSAIGVRTLSLHTPTSHSAYHHTRHCRSVTALEQLLQCLRCGPGLLRLPRPSLGTVDWQCDLSSQPTPAAGPQDRVDHALRGAGSDNRRSLRCHAFLDRKSTRLNSS